VLLAPNVPDAAEYLVEHARVAGISVDRNWFRDRLPRTPSEPTALLREECLRRIGRFSTRVTRRTSFDPSLDLWGFTSTQLPQRFWPCSTPRTLRRTLHLGDPAKQAFVSLALARLLCGSWEQAALLLGWAGHLGRNRARYVIGKIPRPDHSSLIAEIESLARRMRTCPPRLSFASQRLAVTAPLTDMFAPPCGGTWCPCQSVGAN
jgi:hypothetical protein